MQISKTVQEVREYFNPQIGLAGFLYTMSDPTINAKTSLRILRQTIAVFPGCQSTTPPAA